MWSMRKILASLFFLAFWTLNAQMALDSLHVEYSSEFERASIENASKKDIDKDSFLSLLFSMDSTYTSVNAEANKKQIDLFLASMERKVNSYNERKKVKYLFEKIHDQFFKKYELDSYFTDIFRHSIYNCVSGSALYAYTFEYFNIPYQIKETPTHVFLVAYPRRYNIYIETTVPGKSGSYVPSESLIKNAVDELVSMKVITQQDLSTVGYNKAYNDFFYGDENISKRDLIGIQYYNKAIVNFNGKNYEEAYRNISKSILFYKNGKANEFAKGILGLLIDETDFRKFDNFKLFLAYTTISKDMDFLSYKLGRILSEDTWTEANFEDVEREILHIKNKEAQGKLLETYYSFMAQRYYKLQLNKKALVFAEKIYELNPNQLDAKNFICEMEVMGLAAKNLSDDRLTDLASLIEKYPFIGEFGIFNRYKIYLYAYLTTTSFERNESSQGLAYLDNLERLMEVHGDQINFSQEAVGNAYGAIGAFYYRNKNKSKAVDLLKRGLVFSPGNPNITKKLELIQNTY